MRRCPECHTLYEDFVEECLVDGVALGDHHASEVILADTAVSPTGSEAPVVVARPNRTTPVLLAVIAMLLLLILGGGSVYALQPPPSSPPAPVAAATSPKPSQPVRIEPDPVPEPVIDDSFMIKTVPSGAVVMEGGTEVCTTPCSLEHPAGEPLPRTFSISLDGHEAEEYLVDDVGTNHTVRLVAKPSEPKKTARVAPRPSPRVQPKPAPAPAPAPASSKKIGDLKNPFGN